MPQSRRRHSRRRLIRKKWLLVERCRDAFVMCVFLLGGASMGRGDWGSPITGSYCIPVLGPLSSCHPMLSRSTQHWGLPSHSKLLFRRSLIHNPRTVLHLWSRWCKPHLIISSHLGARRLFHGFFFIEHHFLHLLNASWRNLLLSSVKIIIANLRLKPKKKNIFTGLSDPLILNIHFVFFEKKRNSKCMNGTSSDSLSKRCKRK